MPSAVRVDLSLLVRVEEPHDPEADYHEWYVTGDRVKRDVIGRPSNGGWTTWRVVGCNSWECDAIALIREDELATAAHRVAPPPDEED